MNKETTKTTPAAISAFQRFYLEELDTRVQRSEAVGVVTVKVGSAALFFDSETQKFTLVEKLPDVEAANVFDCVAREQWGRTVMVFGHATNTGGFIASGHGVLEGSYLKVKLASGRYYRIEVNPNLAYLQIFAKAEPPKRQETVRSPASNVRKFERPQAKGAAGKPQVSAHTAPAEECEDLTEEDLRRLRGELPLTAKPKKQWRR